MEYQVLVTVDVSDLEKIANQMRMAASITPRVTREALGEIALGRAVSLRVVTPLSERNDPRYGGIHLRDSYYIGISEDTATVSTSDAVKWNLVNRDVGPHVIRPMHKKALSWPSMTGPQEPWWDPKPGYDVAPVFNLRGWMHPGHRSLDLLNKADRDYGDSDQYIMQAVADKIMNAVVYGTYVFGTLKSERARARAETIPGMYGGV